MLNGILFVLFFVICYLLVKHLYVNQQVNQFQKRNSVLEHAKENSFKKLFSKINLIKTKENFLFLQGNPFQLNAISYFSIKIVSALLFAIAGIINYHSLVMAGAFSFLRFFLD